MRKTLMVGQKFSVLGIGGKGGGSLPPKIINVPADYPTLIEANKNIGRHYYIGGDPSVTDNDPTKTDTGQTFLLGQDIMWDGVSAYFKVGDDAIWSDNGSAVKTINPRNVDMQGKGLKDINLWTTIGAANCDYSDINTAIAAGKYNLRVPDNFTQPTPVVTDANFTQITIEKGLTFTGDNNFTVGAGGVRIRKGILTVNLTGTETDFFKGSGTLDIADCSLFNTCTVANNKLANMDLDTKHLIRNCNLVLPNTSTSAGFNNPGNDSLFTDMNVIGGGASSNGFVNGAHECIISNITISGTFSANNWLTTRSGTSSPPVINNIMSKSTSEIKISLTSNAVQISNLSGKITAVLISSNDCSFSNCNMWDIDYLVGTPTNYYFSNCKFNTSSAIDIKGIKNQFVNCEFKQDVAVSGAANKILNCEMNSKNLSISGDSNQVNFVSGINTVSLYGDTNKLFLVSYDNLINSGTGNIIIDAISEDETLSLDSDRLLTTQHAQKTYMDNIAKGITVDYYFSDTPDGVIANYDLMYPKDTGEVESNVNASLTGADILIASFITQTTEPNFTTLLAGIYDIHIHASKSAVPALVTIYAEFYKRSFSGSETLLATSDVSSSLTTSNVGYTLHFSLVDDEILDDTDRLVVKFYGTKLGGGVDPTANLWLEGTNSSRIDIHTTSSSWMLNLQNIIYRNGAGNDSNDGKNMGTPKLTLASAITAGIAQSPSASNMITIKDLGGARIDEDITLPSWMILDTSDAEVVGQVTLGITMAADSHFYFNKASPESGSQCIRISGSGTRYIKGNSTGAALNSTFIVADTNATVYFDIANANAVATGAKFYAIATGTHLYLNARRFAETVASTSDAASNVVAHIGERAGVGYTDMINHAGDFITRGLDDTGYHGFGGVASVDYPRLKCKHYKGTLAAAGNFVIINAATLGLNSALQIVHARVYGWYPAANAWMPDGSQWGEWIDFRIGSTGLQVRTPSGSTGMAGEDFHLVYWYQQTNFLT